MQILPLRGLPDRFAGPEHQAKYEAEQQRGDGRIQGKMHEAGQKANTDREREILVNGTRWRKN